MGLPPQVIDGSFRIYLCRDTGKEEIDALVEAVRSGIVARFLK